ncbi:MAG: hypothetical protein JW869_04875 [Candidatus Omnitrophica bacterium]|nr:hypothetical protein [Candidatus Omnitrophota bacterium]
MRKKYFEKNKSAWEKLGISYKAFLKKEKEISKYTKKGYRFENSLFSRVVNLHIDSMGYTYDLLHNGDKDLFYNAFIKLGVKVLHNSEAIRNLVNFGLFGSGNTLYRPLLFDTMMIWYLYFNPHLTKYWLEESFVTYKDKKWRSKFSESTIIKNLKEKGKKYKLNLDYEMDFAFYSKPAHPCHFGVRFFQNDKNELSYLPDFSMSIGHYLFIEVLSLLPFPTQVLLLKEKDRSADNHKIWLLRHKYNDIMPILNELGRKTAKFHKEYFGAKPSEEITKS